MALIGRIDVSPTKMASTWNSGSTIQPPGYRNMFNENMSTEGLTFVDFLPEVQRPGGLFSKPVYEVFRSLVDRANDWLRANPQWEIKTCESVEFKDKGNTINSEKMIYLEYGEVQTWYIRGLRLWISSRKDGEEKSQQIGYLNVVPEEIEPGGVFSSPVYENLNDVLHKFNQMIRTRPIPGRIITIESQEMKVSSDGVNPDKSSWVENGSSATRFLFVLRIFYEITEANSEEIGIQDFIPDVIKKGGVFTMPTYEAFSLIVNKASQWCFNRADIRICNAQTLEMKMIRGHEIDTQKMNFVEHGNRATFYLRILRLAYTKSVTQSNLYPPLSPITRLTCKTFVPVQLTSGLFVPEFETLQETKSRVSAWMKATGARVISAETVAMRIHTGAAAREGTEASFTHNRAEQNEYFIFIIRAYINGLYKEPPTEMLPPVPDYEDQSCCILS